MRKPISIERARDEELDRALRGCGAVKSQRDGPAFMRCSSARLATQYSRRLGLTRHIPALDH
jgi:hypothetical protein